MISGSTVRILGAIQIIRYTLLFWHFLAPTLPPSPRVIFGEIFPDPPTLSDVTLFKRENYALSSINKNILRAFLSLLINIGPGNKNIFMIRVKKCH